MMPPPLCVCVCVSHRSLSVSQTWLASEYFCPRIFVNSALKPFCLATLQPDTFKLPMAAYFKFFVFTPKTDPFKELGL